MQRFRLALENFFQRQIQEDEDVTEAFDRMGREIQGSIFMLLTLFSLVALASYVPLDTLSLASGQLDQVSNLGGIVGAIVAEWCLGSVGVMGYGIIALTAWLAFCSFRGVPFRDNLLRLTGLLLAATLGAMSCHLIFSGSYPEASLLQGGWVGVHGGGFLMKYFNVAGALLIIGAGFLLTFILTTGVSLSGSVERMFAHDEEEEDDDDSEYADPKLASRGNDDDLNELDEEDDDDVKPPPVRKAARSTKKRKSRAKKSADTDGEDDPEQTDELDLAEMNEGTGDDGPKDLIPFQGPFTLPTARLLKDHVNGAKKLSKGELKENGRTLCEHLLSFQITGEIKEIHLGPVLITYEFKPSAGVKLSKIANLAQDLGLVLGAKEIRIQAPIPGKSVVGIEVPRASSEVISFKEIVKDDGFYDKKLKLPIALGKSTFGKPVFGDLAAMPHLLVAGATGSGKSVFINTMIMSFLYRMSPRDLRMILVDPKMLELNCFEGLPHLATSVITRPAQATSALNWAVDEMERRYDLMSKTGSKNIESYNTKNKGKDKLPFIVIVVDELADLMMSGDKDAVEVAITRLAQKARAAGIHLVIATQRPSTDVITGLIKANIPSRLSFKVPSGTDSRTVLDASGAQDLIGRGDSLMIRPGTLMERIHGCFVSEEELQRVVKNVLGGKKHTKNYIKF